MKNLRYSTALWASGLLLASSWATLQVATADNLSSCNSGNGCLFADANYWALIAERAGGSNPYNIPWNVNDWASSYANKSSWTMTVYTNTNSGGTCGARAANTKGNLYSPFQDSISSMSMRAGGC